MAGEICHKFGRFMVVSLGKEEGQTDCDKCVIEINLSSVNEYSPSDAHKQQICALLKAIEIMLIGL